MNFQIRLAQSSDALGIAQVHVRSWQFSYKDIIDSAALASLNIANRAQRWEKIIADKTETNWVAESEHSIELSDNSSPQHIIGFASVGLSRDADLENKLELYGLYLDPIYFGRGIGYALMNTVLGQKPAVLWILEGNKRAYRFYNRQGFQADGTHDIFNFQGKDYPKLRMQRDGKSVSLNRADIE